MNLPASYRAFGNDAALLTPLARGDPAVLARQYPLLAAIIRGVGPAARACLRSCPHGFRRRDAEQILASSRRIDTFGEPSFSPRPGEVLP